jgi:hypothetical protein
MNCILKVDYCIQFGSSSDDDAGVEGAVVLLFLANSTNLEALLLDDGCPCPHGYSQMRGEEFHYGTGFNGISIYGLKMNDGSYFASWPSL